MITTITVTTLSPTKVTFLSLITDKLNMLVGGSTPFFTVNEVDNKITFTNFANSNWHGKLIGILLLWFANHPDGFISISGNTEPNFIYVPDKDQADLFSFVIQLAPLVDIDIIM